MLHNTEVPIYVCGGAACTLQELSCMWTAGADLRLARLAIVGVSGVFGALLCADLLHLLPV